MRRISLAIVFIAVFSFTFIAVSAKSLKEVTLNGQESGSLIVKYGTEADFHTSIYPTYLNENSINIENTIQRRNSSGNWNNIIQNRFPVSKVKRSYILNVSLTKTADTRTIWWNIDSGTRVIADLYINNGFDHDIDIVPKIVGSV